MSLLRGQLAQEAGVNVETLRFYERRGLLPSPPRRPSGYREYPPESVDLVRFVQRAQVLGFSLQEIKELMKTREVPRATCGDVVELAERKVQEIESKIRSLQSMKAALRKLLKDCTGNAPITRCPIIESLASSPGEPARPTRQVARGGRRGKRSKT